MHRYGAHKMFTLNKFWEKFFFLLSYVSQGSSYLSPRAYAILHRMHHAYSDTEKDPHSPHNSTNIFSMMMDTKKIYNGFAKDQIKPEAKFEKNLPHWAALDAIGDTWTSRIVFASLYIAFYIHFVPAGYAWLYLLLPIHFLMGPTQGAIVNWFGHKVGYRNFNEDDRSTNTFVLDIFLLGELFQNNHHHAPARANFGAKWYELDPIYPIIWLLNGIGVIKLVKE